MKSYNNILSFCYFFVVISWFKFGIVKGIIGGNVALPNECRYHVSIYNKEGYVCNGAIIDETFVLSAARCFINETDQFIDDQFTVIAGIHQLNSEAPSRVMISIAKIYVPLEFKRVNPNPESLRNYRESGDIAVIKLSEKLTIDEESGLRKLILPERRNGHLPRYMNEIAIVSGFGVEKVSYLRSQKNRGSSKIKSDSKLKYVDATILQKPTCKNRWMGARIGNEHLCAQVNQPNDDSQAGVCEGDIGGPLVYNGLIIIGILSHNHPTCHEKWHSGLYTRVSSYMPFIEYAKRDRHMVDIRIADYQARDGVMEIIHNERAFDLISNTRS